LLDIGCFFNFVSNDLHIYFLIACQIPIYKGAHVSLIEPVANEDPYHGHDGFGNSTHDEEPDLKHLQSEHGVNALARIARENPGEISSYAVHSNTGTERIAIFSCNRCKNI